jgi:hypothetical protein
VPVVVSPSGVNWRVALAPEELPKLRVAPELNPVPGALVLKVMLAALAEAARATTAKVAAMVEDRSFMSCVFLR